MKLPEFCDAEDKIDAYCLRFERYADNAGWNRYVYVLGLSCLLIGRALEVYRPLPRYQLNKYDKLKQALLVKLSLTKDDFRKKITFTTASKVLVRQLHNIYLDWIISLING